MTAKGVRHEQVVTSLDTTRLETFVLARLLIRPKSGIGMSDVSKQLSPFVSHVLSDAGWRSALTDIVHTLRKTELIEPTELRLTAKGRTETMARLSLKELKHETSWSTFLAETVVPAAMGINAAQADLKTADDLVAVLLVREYELSIPGKPTLARVLNAMVWKALGVNSDQRLTAGALQRATNPKPPTPTPQTPNPVYLQT
ncbi:MAG: hypothetical protein AAF449_08020 [Myxococcota bacterium]